MKSAPLLALLFLGCDPGVSEVSFADLEPGTVEAAWYSADLSEGLVWQEGEPSPWTCYYRRDGSWWHMGVDLTVYDDESFSGTSSDGYTSFDGRFTRRGNGPDWLVSAEYTQTVGAMESILSSMDLVLWRSE